MAQASTLVLFNKKLRILPINVERTNVQNPLDFLPHFQLIGTSEDACAIVGVIIILNIEIGAFIILVMRIIRNIRLDWGLQLTRLQVSH